MTAKISRVLPSGGSCSLGVPVIVKVTIKADSFVRHEDEGHRHVSPAELTVYGKSNVTTQVRYTTHRALARCRDSAGPFVLYILAVLGTALAALPASAVFREDLRPTDQRVSGVTTRERGGVVKP